jgi:two-component system sensor histidine kinase YesM
MKQKKRSGTSMSTVLVVMVLSIVAVCLCIGAGLFIARYRTATVQNAKTSSEQAVAQVSNTVGNYIQDMHDVMELLKESLNSSVDNEEFFDAFLHMRPDVVAVTTYDGAGNLRRCWATGHTARKNYLVNLSYNPALFSENSISAPHVETIFEGYYPWVVTMAATLDPDEESRSVALDLSFTSISSYINNVGIGAHGYCYIMDASGNIIYHPQQQLLYSGLKAEDTAALVSLPDGSYASDTVIYSLRSVPGSRWRIIGVSYVDELVTANVAGMIRISAAIVIAVLIITVLTSLVVSSILSRPLHELADAMENFEQDADHYAYQPIRGSREVHDLSASFDHMVVKIQALMAKVREEEVDLRKTELKALQAQINPHFLYNTLDSIAWMCEQGRSADAVQMVHALATLFRISISKGHELIPISKEIEHAESYLQIQKYRYKNQFEYTFDVDPACRDYLCNKITLQPIIENAIYHGLDLMVEAGAIDVQVRQDGDDILFSVADNGVGMTQEQADAMLHKEPGDRTGIGIKNVNDRLRIYFGEGYGLKITSELDVGTCVEIRMPKVKEGTYEAK